MYRYVGLSGKLRSGKDTAADILVAHYGFEKIAFADVLRDFMIAQDPYVRRDDARACDRLSVVIDRYGWDGYKNSPYSGELRALIQRTGTEAGRNTIYPNVWVDAAIRRAKTFERVVFSDVRFPNEADAVKSLGKDSAVWRISRPNFEVVGTHTSETALDDYEFDAWIKNDSTIEELSNQIGSFLVD